MEYGLIGEKLSHSHSPAIHRLLGDYSNELFPIPPEAVEGFLINVDFRGINVTIPYKRAVIPFCKTLDRYAERTGSVNTVVKDEKGEFHGFNTDYPGFLYMADRRGFSSRAKRSSSSETAARGIRPAPSPRTKGHYPSSLSPAQGRTITKTSRTIRIAPSSSTRPRSGCFRKTQGS
jgi:hypothetical protein